MWSNIPRKMAGIDGQLYMWQRGLSIIRVGMRQKGRFLVIFWRRFMAPTVLKITQRDKETQDYMFFYNGYVVGRVVEMPDQPYWEKPWISIWLFWTGYTSQWFSTKQEAFGFISRQFERS